VRAYPPPPRATNPAPPPAGSTAGGMAPHGPRPMRWESRNRSSGAMAGERPLPRRIGATTSACSALPGASGSPSTSSQWSNTLCPAAGVSGRGVGMGCEAFHMMLPPSCAMKKNKKAQRFIFGALHLGEEEPARRRAARRCARPRPRSRRTLRRGGRRAWRRAACLPNKGRDVSG
jgi:hypothetical protein